MQSEHSPSRGQLRESHRIRSLPRARVNLLSSSSKPHRQEASAPCCLHTHSTKEATLSRSPWQPKTSACHFLLRLGKRAKGRVVLTGVWTPLNVPSKSQRGYDLTLSCESRHSETPLWASDLHRVTASGQVGFSDLEVDTHYLRPPQEQVSL